MAAHVSRRPRSTTRSTVNALRQRFLLPFNRRRSGPRPLALTEEMGPEDAADLLASTRHDARRGFEPRTQLVYMALAVLVGRAYGTLSLSVRHQDPYIGPSLAVIALVYGFVGVSVSVSATAYRRATRGVHRRSRREDVIRGVALGVRWIAVWVFDGALKANGFSPAIVYGVFDAAGLGSSSARRSQHSPPVVSDGETWRLDSRCS